MTKRAKSRTELRDALRDARRQLRQIGMPSATSGNGFVTSKKVAYEKMISLMRELIHETVPQSAKVIVVSKGDPELLKLDGRPTRHFPQDDKGNYSAAYPPDSADAIHQFERLRADGAGYFVIPATSLWWLDHYKDFRLHLNRHYRVVASDENVCAIFEIAERVSSSATRHSADESKKAPVEMETDKSEIELRLELAAAQWPDDHEVNMALAQFAWQRGELDAVEERLMLVIDALPSGLLAINEVTKLLCNRLENPDPASESALIERLRAHLANPSHSELISPETHLRVAELLGNANQLGSALRSLKMALSRLDLNSEALQDFLFRIVKPIVTEKTAIPLHERRTLAAFLTHAGNGFSAVQDWFKAHACFHLALTADDGSWNSAGGAARFNLAFLDLARGEPGAVLDHLAPASRVYPDESARIMWPSDRGRLWPDARFDSRDAFEKLKPAGAAWPKITVITPSYNQSSYVEETLQSVLNQHYPALEYIVIDGGSTDGTIDILKRYEPRLSQLIIEPDEGQTDAINKGLRLATGDIISWINSDDMLGPGALFMIALAHIEENADIIAGFCCEHAGRRFGVINLPAVTQATFNVECLGDIFEYWLNGHYFYQPEVAFSRRILEKAGGTLDSDLHYTMDYEFWLRCAAAGGRISVVHWPVGLFRKHQQQKTANLDSTVIEQAQVRDRFVVPQPKGDRQTEIKRRLQRAFRSATPHVSVLSARSYDIFSPDTARELAELFAAAGLSVGFYEQPEEIGRSDSELTIVLVRGLKERESLHRLRERGYDGALTGWFWENHHDVFENYRATADLDVCVPGHAWAGSYLRSQRNVMAPCVPVCTTNWTQREARELFEGCGRGERGNELFGAIVRYPFAEKRDRLIRELIENGTGGVHHVDEIAPGRSNGVSLADRFRKLASHKTSLCLPRVGELSQSVFDALITGQIPIVQADMHDLDTVIPRQLQEQLPIVRFSRYTPKAVKDAHRKALRLFDSGGLEGAVRRHEFAVEHHTLVPRIRSIIAWMQRLSA